MSRVSWAKKYHWYYLNMCTCCFGNLASFLLFRHIERDQGRAHDELADDLEDECKFHKMLGFYVSLQTSSSLQTYSNFINIFNDHNALLFAQYTDVMGHRYFPRAGRPQFFSTPIQHPQHETPDVLTLSNKNNNHNDNSTCDINSYVIIWNFNYMVFV